MYSFYCFRQNAGLLGQQVHVNRVARKSYESMASSSLSLKQVDAGLIQAEVNYCLSAHVSHSCIRGSVCMFYNGVIHLSIELENPEAAGTDSTTRCNFERLRSDICMESRYFLKNH